MIADFDRARCKSIRMLDAVNGADCAPCRCDDDNEWPAVVASLDNRGNERW